MKLSTEVLDDNLAEYIQYCLKNSPPFRLYEKGYSLKEFYCHKEGSIYEVNHIPSGRTVQEFYTEKEAKLFCQMMYFSDLDWDFEDYDITTFSHEQKKLLHKTFALFSRNQSLVYHLGCCD